MFGDGDHFRTNHKRLRFVIAGNHDFWDTNWRLNRGWMSVNVASDPSYFQKKISNAKVDVSE